MAGPESDFRPRVLIVSASVGAGHDGAAQELARRADNSGYVVDRVDFLDLLPLAIGRLLRAVYRLQMRLAPATWGWLLPLLGSRSGNAIVRVTSRLARRRLLAACHPEPCLVVSTYPLASQALSRLRMGGEFWSPVVTFLTDMSVHPLWVAPGIDAHLALHEVPAAQARALGARNVEVVGPVVAPSFAPVGPGTRRSTRTLLGLPDDLPLALVVAGSWGVGDIVHTVADLATGRIVRPVVVCGTNKHLLASLDDMPGVVALAWVDDMAGLMNACDVVVQNAGGLTSLEALQCRLPVVTYRSLPGHGLTNSHALEEAGWAPWARTPGELASCLLDALTGPPMLAAPGEVPWARLSLRPVPVAA